METKITNVLLPEFFFDYMEHWSSKQIKEILYAVRNYAFNGELPVFDKFDDASNKKLTKHFNLVKDFIDKSQANYNIKSKTYNHKIG